MSRGEGFGGGGDGGVGFPVETEGKRVGVGRVGGVRAGTDKGTGKSMCTCLSKLRNGKQLQAQKEEIINLTQKRLKRDFSLFLQRDSKETQKWLFELKKSLLSLFGGQKVTF